ncbi:MAG: MBL fold metallo-hydrolase [Planctomycetota bacterium]|jgi:phosphoribosyl 1,2-cyclic phosphodiesterase
MSLSFCVLGSGSAGNSTLVRLGAHSATRHVLIDAGLSPRQTALRLGPLGIGLDDISDILLTHIDHDHFHPGWRDAGSNRIACTWRAARRHLRQARAAGLPARDTAPFGDDFEMQPATRVEVTMLPHDELGSTGLVIDHDGVRLGFATDLGRVPETLLQRFEDLAALALESNYDPHLERASSRPDFLKQRIMGGLGHLSNEQALEAVLHIAGRCDLRHIALLHLSRQCNDPAIVRGLFARHAPHLLGRLTITNQHEPTPLLHVEPPLDGPDGAPRAGRQIDFLESLPGP